MKKSELRMKCATQIAVAYLSNESHSVPLDRLPAMMGKIVESVDVICGTKEPAKEYPPAFDVKKSITDDHIISLIDGKPYKMLKRHLGMNDLTPDDYRERYGLPHDYPMTAPSYSAKRRELAKSIGLGHHKNKSGAALN